MTKEIAADLEALEIWDADDYMEDEYVKTSPQFLFLEKVYQYDKKVLEYLLFNICLRVIPSWEINCDNQQLRPTLFALKNYLLGDAPKESLLEFNTQIKTPKMDCTYSDTSGASGALFNSVMSILENNLVFAAYVVSDAEIANTREFRTWFEEIAVPVSFEKRICNLQEAQEHTFSDYIPFYEDLFLQMESPK